MIKIDLGKNFVTLIDDDDYMTISKFHWRAKHNKSNDTYTAVSSFRDGNKVETILMHRLIMDCGENKVVNHINKDTLDNRKSNLRICTRMDASATQKLTNKKFKGIYWRKEKEYYEVRLTRNYKSYYLGSSRSLIDAIKLYNDGAKRIFGDYAFLNDIKSISDKNKNKYEI